MMKLVSIRNVGTVRYLQLDYPDKKNGLDLAMAEELLECVEQANVDPDCQIIVFASTGRSYFSSGPDLESLIDLAGREDGPVLLDDVVTKLNRIILAIHHSPKITMAALHGYAFGGGLNVFLACDYRVAEAKTKFIENFFYMGVTPDLSSSYFLPRLIGPTRTMELLLSGRLFTAQETADWGLFHEVIEKRSEMMARVQELCERFLTGELSTITRMKELLRRSQTNSLEEQLDLEKASLCERFLDPSLQARLKSIQS